MIYKTIRAISVAALLVNGLACTDVLTEPKSTVTGANVFNDASSYRAFLAKIYAGLTVSGQQGPAGKPDIQGIDEGFSEYVRLVWQMQELPTDEAVIAWNDTGVQELNTQIWSTSNQFLQAMYYRIFFQVAMVNEFLRETSDEKLAERAVPDALRAQIKTYRAEARFLRALSYWHGIDLFGSIPLVVETDPIGSTPPKQATRADLFNYVESELKAIQADLPAPNSTQYGRASSAAASMLLAKLYMNAAVYTGTARYSDARAAVEAVINSGGYSLDPSYRHLFLADNNTSKEIIFPVPMDGTKTQSYGGTTFLIHASVGGNMNAAAFGIDGGWWGLRVKPEVITLFSGASGDKRGTFFTDGQTLQIPELTNFNAGYASAKYANVTSTGEQGSNAGFADTDYPMFRLGDAYLMYAEAVLRSGGGTRAQALTYVNALRTRAYGNTSGNITDAQLTLNFIKDERTRELFWEGHRRTDLIRFGQFTDQGTWAWKGGIQAGRATEAFRNLYPLPSSELLANPNLTQNSGY
jgi:starch-binding outer membrane protein, SusD/RagB family